MARIYKPGGAPFAAAAGSIEYFLTERYCLYNVSGGQVRRVEIHHPAWPLQQAEAIVERNTMAAACGLHLPSTAPLLHFAQRQDTVAFAPHTVA